MLNGKEIVMSTPPSQYAPLENRRKQAKDLLKSVKNGNGEALSRFSKYHPKHADKEFCLADAQLVVAREHGFSSWPKPVRKT